MCAHPHYPRPTWLSNPGYAPGQDMCGRSLWQFHLHHCDSSRPGDFRRPGEMSFLPTYYHRAAEPCRRRMAHTASNWDVQFCSVVCCGMWSPVCRVYDFNAPVVSQFIGWVNNCVRDCLRERASNVQCDFNYYKKKLAQKRSRSSIQPQLNNKPKPEVCV